MQPSAAPNGDEIFQKEKQMLRNVHDHRHQDDLSSSHRTLRSRAGGKCVERYLVNNAEQLNSENKCRTENSMEETREVRRREDPHGDQGRNESCGSRDFVERSARPWGRHNPLV
jgi:hypothetical protein